MEEDLSSSSSERSIKLHVSPPGKFDFENGIKSWPAWKQHWERYRCLSGLDSRSERKQVTMLLYCMGPEVDDLICRLHITQEELAQYDSIISKLESHFVDSINVTYERTKFFSRNQMRGESVENFMADLYRSLEKCRFGELKDDMLMHKIIQGIEDQSLSQSLQTMCATEKLTLSQVENRVRVCEKVRQQQNSLNLKDRSVEETDVDVIRKPEFKRYEKRKKQHESHHCKYCGWDRPHPTDRCPAKNLTCFRCGIRGHFASVCKQANPQLSSLELEECVSNEAWTIQVLIDDKPVRFKIDTGADCSVISHKDFKRLFPKRVPDTTLQKLWGAGKSPVNVVGKVQTTMKYNGMSVEQELFVIDGQRWPLLGRPAINALRVIKFVETLTKEDVLNEYANLFKGIGRLKGEYNIQLREDAKPYALPVARRVALPLRNKVEEELKKLEDQKIISRITEPTDWVAGMVVVPKQSGEVRICIDYTELNKCIKRERLMLPSVNDLLAQLKQAKVWSKLDCKSGYFQCVLSEKSAKLTTFLTPFGRFYFNRLPMGICSAPEYYQRQVSSLLQGMKGVVSYLDDVLVFGKTQKEHDERLRSVLNRMLEAGITLNRDKCEFSVASVKFLGHVISTGGVKPDRGKIEAVMGIK